VAIDPELDRNLAAWRREKARLKKLGEFSGKRKGGYSEYTEMQNLEFDMSGRPDYDWESDVETTDEEPEYDWTVTSDVEEIVTEEAPSEPPAVDLPDPSEVIHVEQSIYGTITTTRPDRKKEYGYYDSNSEDRPMSTRVQGMQWVPTSYVTSSTPEINNPLEDSKAMLYGYGPNEFSTGVYGDILIAFARPSKAQSHAIYVFSGNNVGSWENLIGSSSLGRGIKLLAGGRLLQGSDEARYKKIHGETETKDAWEDWIFNYPEFHTIRSPNDGKGTGGD